MYVFTPHSILSFTKFTATTEKREDLTWNFKQNIAY